MAQTCRDRPDQNFVRTGVCDLHVLDLQRGAHLAQNGSLHSPILSCRLKCGRSAQHGQTVLDNRDATLGDARLERNILIVSPQIEDDRLARENRCREAHLMAQDLVRIKIGNRFQYGATRDPIGAKTMQDGPRKPDRLALSGSE